MFDFNHFFHEQFNIELVERFDQLCRAWFGIALNANEKCLFKAGLNAYTVYVEPSPNRDPIADKVCMAIFLERLKTQAQNPEQIKHNILAAGDSWWKRYERTFFTILWTMDKFNAEYAYRLTDFIQLATWEKITPKCRKQLVKLEAVLLKAVDYRLGCSAADAYNLTITIKGKASAQMAAVAAQQTQDILLLSPAHTKRPSESLPTEPATAVATIETHTGKRTRLVC